MESDENIKQLEETLKNDVDFEPIKSPVKRFRYFWKDKDGKELSYKEFMARWKTGMKGITQYQQSSMQLNSTYIMLVGILCGFVITLFNLKNLWWLSIILAGALFNTTISALGVWQKKIALWEMEKLIRGVDNDKN
jgi:hypothetical protein